jgi:hypothetical protein
MLHQYLKFLSRQEQTTNRIERSITAAKPSGPGVNERFFFLDSHAFGLGEDVVSGLFLSVYKDYCNFFGKSSFVCVLGFYL